MSKIDEIAKAVEAGKSKDIQGLVEAALAEGVDPAQILNEGMIAAMGVIGEKFQKADNEKRRGYSQAETCQRGNKPPG